MAIVLTRNGLHMTTDEANVDYFIEQGWRAAIGPEPEDPPDRDRRLLASIVGLRVTAASLDRHGEPTIRFENGLELFFGDGYLEWGP